MNFEKLESSFKALSKIANSLIKDKSKTLNKVKEGIKKAAENEGALATVWDKLQLFFSLVKDYANGNYKDIPKSAIITVVAALLYFITPIDIIPDFVVGLGFLDDAFILGLAYKRVAKELNKYQDWKDSQKEVIHI